MQYRLQQLEFQTHSGQSPEKEGLLAVDRHGRILFADYRDDTILARNRWAVSPAGKLRGHTRGSGTRMARAIRSCWSAQSGLQPRGGMFQMTGPAGRALRVDVGAPPGQVPRFVADFSASGQVAALVLIEDLAESRLPQATGLGESFGLTPAETAVALESLSGKRRKDIALTLGLSESTVRTHLSRIYEKTGAKRQAELIRLLQDEN
jgi:DNA-binding CsgD family transcriptional regulator